MQMKATNWLLDKYDERNHKTGNMFEEREWSIGTLIKKSREEQKISGTQLSYGLCSPATLSRIENGEREMNLFFSIMLLGRLGYDLDKFELYGSKEEFEQYEERIRIQKLRRKHEYEEMLAALERYEQSWKNAIEADSLQQQFIYSIRGLFYVQKKRDRQGMDLLKKAIALTMPEWDLKWFQNCIIGETELDLFGMLADAIEIFEDKEEAFCIREKIYTCLKRKPEVPVQMQRLYTSIICKMIPEMLEKGNIGRALELCEDGLSALAQKGRFYHWPDLLYWKGCCLKELYRMGKLEKDSSSDVYLRAMYIYRLLGNQEMAETIKNNLNKEAAGWEFIKSER